MKSSIAFCVTFVAFIDSERAELYAPKKVTQFAASFDAALARHMTNKSVMPPPGEFVFPKAINVR